jgi:hypothetical protein
VARGADRESIPAYRQKRTTVNRSLSIQHAQQPLPEQQLQTQGLLEVCPSGGCCWIDGTPTGAARFTAQVSLYSQRLAVAIAQATYATDAAEAFG